ncbi:MAG TPA: hypothetical protein V6D17_07375 [Candidatus Obscuribacterales bacterium]
MKTTKQNRSERGISLILSCVCAALFIALIYIAFHYSTLTAGSQQVRNAVDAATLNVSKRVVDLGTPPQPIFKDCADSSGSIRLTNINRVWGKAYLINANVEAMERDSQSTPLSTQNADQAYMQAQAINDSLVQQLKSRTILDEYFKQLAEKRTAGLLGQGATVSTSQSNSWSFGMIDRGCESNLSFDTKQLPGYATLPGVGSGSKTYIQGYSPVTAHKRSFCFTSFRPNEMPHLISDPYFDKNEETKNAIANAVNPIPNAFKVTGVATNSKTPLSAAASAVANPQRQYTLAIPHAYVAIQFTNRAKWYVEGKKVNETSYGAKPEEQWGVRNYPIPPPKGGTLNGYASLGNEYAKANLWQAINALPGDHTQPLKKVLQRIQEIKADFSMSDLQQILEKQQFQNAGKFYIYPTYKTCDLTDPQIKVTSDKELNLPAWLDPTKGTDGLEAVVATEEMQKDEPNYNWQSTKGEHHTEVSGTIKWAPGSGVNTCLGELRLDRLTECYFSIGQ